MGWPRRTRDDREQKTLRVPRSDERYPPPHDEPRGYRSEHRSERRERADSYWTYLVLGLAAPFLLAVPLYPLAWYPVWFVVLPVAGFLRAALSSAQPTPPPPAPGSPMPWDLLGPFLSPQVALTWAVSVAVAWLVLSRVAGRRSGYPDESPAKRGFRAGLRLTLLAAFLLAVLWANRMLAAS